MFESDDLILRKNEKNFLLCLLEIARYGARFGVSVPALIKFEDEIEREIQRDKHIDTLPMTEKLEETPTLLVEERLTPIPSVPRLNRDENPTANEVMNREIDPSKRTVTEAEEQERSIEPPASSSQLHKTVSEHWPDASAMIVRWSVGRPNCQFMLLCPSVSRDSHRRGKVSHWREWNDHLHSSECRTRRSIFLISCVCEDSPIPRDGPRRWRLGHLGELSE